MTILFDATRPVKPTRPFAQGLSSPRRATYTAADAQWWAENSPANASGYEVVSRPAVHPANRIRPRCPSERLTDSNAEYIDRRVWAMGHDA